MFGAPGRSALMFGAPGRALHPYLFSVYPYLFLTIIIIIITY
jgi:hypothetical protein